MSSFYQNMQQLENMLRDSVSRRAKGNPQRALEKAFKYFDADGTGDVNAEEFARGVDRFLQGVAPEDIKSLFDRYDVDDSGTLSVEEFAGGLFGDGPGTGARRTPAPAKPAAGSDDIVAKAREKRNRRKAKQAAERAAADKENGAGGKAGGGGAGSDPVAARYQAKLVDDAMASAHRPRVAPRTLIAIADAIRAGAKKAAYASGRALPKFTRLSLARSDRDFAKQKAALMRAFRRLDTQRGQRRGTGFVDEKQFAAALAPFMGNGGYAPATGHGFAMRALWEKCNKGEYRRFVVGLYRRPTDGPMSGRTTFINGKDDRDGCRRPDGTVVNKFGFVVPDSKLPMAALQGDAPGIVPAQREGEPTNKALPPNRPVCGKGPFDPLGAGERPVRPLKRSEVPQRLRYRYSKTAVQPPSDWDPREMTRSAKKPTQALDLEFVYGYPVTKPLANALHFTAGKELVYFMAGLGIVYDPRSHSQRFFKGHDDDITCIAVDPTGTLVATGQMGKDCVVHVWDAETCTKRGTVGLEALTVDDAAGPSRGKEKKRKSLLKGQVCAVAFSQCSRYVVAVGADTHHALGVWEWSTGKLIQDAQTMNGEPPRVYDVVWSPWVGPKGQQYFVTIGPKHLKFWTFNPKADTTKGEYILSSKAGKFERSGAKAFPKGGGTRASGGAFHCVAFGEERVRARAAGSIKGLPKSSYTFPGYTLTAGTDGRIFAWVDGVIAKVWQGHKKGTTVRCMATKGGRLWTGGDDGLVRVWDADGQHDGGYHQVDEFDLPEGKQLTHGKMQADDGGGHGAPAGGGGGAAGGGKKIVGARPPPQPHVEAPIGLAVLKTSEKRANVTRVVVGTSHAGLFLLPPNSTRGGRVGGAKCDLKPLIRGHFGDLYGLSYHPLARNSFVTVGEDKQLCLWDAEQCAVVKHCFLPTRARSCDVSPDAKHVAVGLINGGFCVVDVDDMKIHAAHKHMYEAVDDIKFSPDGTKLAVASHDNFIDIHDATKGYKFMHRCKGHTSFVTHVDWSADNTKLMSNCASYEILYWDATNGKQIRSSHDDVESDTKWDEWTCVLGFPVMGIWPDGSDGSDVNSIHRSHDGKLLAVGDDSGQVRLLNNPCVVEDAPSKDYFGHSSHVMNVRFLTGDTHVVSVGGCDEAIFQWKLLPQDLPTGDPTEPVAVGSAHRWETSATWK